MRKPLWMLLLVCLVIIQPLCLAAATSTDNWTTFRHDPNHSGYTTDDAPTNSAKPLWKFSTGAEVLSSPSIADGRVLVGSKDRNLYCLNASSGVLLWNFTAGGEIDSSPCIYGGRVYVGSDDGWVYSLDIVSGTPVWISLAGGLVRSSPIVLDGQLFIGSGKHDLYSFNVSDGSLIWVFPTTYRVDSSPAAANGIVYVASDDFFVYALNASNGKEIWRQHTGSTINSPSVNNGYLYIGSYDGYVFGLNASTGAKIWSFQTQNSVASSTAVADGIVYVGSEDGSVYGLNAYSGEKIWQTPTGYWVWSSPAVAGGNVYVGSEDYNIYCFNASTGAKQWSYATGNLMDSSPAIVDGVIFVGSYDANVYAFKLTNDDVASQENTGSLPWTTVVFDATAFATAALILYTLVRFTYINRQMKNSSIILSKKGWLLTHFDSLTILLLFALSIIFFINLGSGSLWTADEQTYSQWAYYMVKSGDYLHPYAFGGVAVWIGKPPLYMWLISLGYQAFGVSNFVTRLWSPIFAALTLVSVYFLGKELYNRYVGLGSALVLTTFNMFYLFARHAMTDIAFVFFIVASIYFFVLSEKTHKTNRYLLLDSLFFGLALLTKQVEALLIPLVLLVYLVVSKRKLKAVFSKSFIIFLGAGLLVLLPWLLYMAVSYGSNFYDWFVVYCGFQRTLTPLEGHGGSYLFYFNYLAENETLWAILLPFACGFCLYKLVLKRSRADTLLFAWVAIVFLVFTVAQTKLAWYLLPAFPAFAIAISNLLFQACLKLKHTFRKKQKATAYLAECTDNR